jgi:hypothetical protein
LEFPEVKLNESQTAGYVCSTCGRQHDEIPLSFAADFPDPYANLSREERENRALISSDQCIIDHDQFYLRGCIELPIVASDEIFLWGVWARIHENDFDQIHENWNSAGRENQIGPFKGRLANSLSIYPETLNMKLAIEIQPVSQRPLFLLEEPDHPLTQEQQNGLRREKAREYACLLLRMTK